MNHKYAIVILVDQDYRTSQAYTGSDWISNAMSMMSYATSGFIAIILADYIRRLGYPAKAHYAPYYDGAAASHPLGRSRRDEQDRRLGAPSVPGTSLQGGRGHDRSPFASDKPIDFGLQDFCSKCKKCARECPSGAISDGGKEMFNGYEKWPMDKKKCTGMRVGNQRGSGCGTCVKVCPWSKPYTPFHRAVSWAMRHSGVARSLAIRADDFLGYGKPDYGRKWWFDLEDVAGDGILKIPANKRSEFEGK